MAKTPYSGDLRHSVILQTRTRSTDTGGGFTSSWEIPELFLQKLSLLMAQTPMPMGCVSMI